MPVGGNDELNGVRCIDADAVQVVKRGGLLGGGVEAGVNDGPVTVAEVQNDTFSKAGTKYGNLQFSRGWSRCQTSPI